MSATSIFSNNLNAITDWGQSPNHGSANGDTQGVVNGQLEFFHNSMNLSGTADSWEVTVTNENRKRTNPMSGGIDLTRGSMGY